MQRGRLQAGRAAEAIDDLGDWDVERIPHRTLLRAAWSHRANLTAYDALYVATATLRHAAVLTADGPLARAPIRGVTILDVRSA